MQSSGTGIGRALQRAREVRGKSLEEASRETRIRAEYLKALEADAFDRLRGDVYARGFLRSYSSYLGLDADKVLAVYARTHGRHRTTPAPAPQSTAATGNGNGHPAFAPRRTRWGVAAGVALAILVAIGAIAFARRGEAPVPEALPTPSLTLEAVGRPVVADLTAALPVDATITVDGEVAFHGRLVKGEARSFRGDRSVEVSLSSGGIVAISVNGFSLGQPGNEGTPWSGDFGPDDYRSTGSASGP